MSELTCRCGKPTRDDRYVCDECASNLARALGDCTWINEQLDISITRQRAIPFEGGAPNAERGLPWHDRAAEAQRTLHGLLATWVRFCDEEQVRGRPTWQPSDRIPSLARWLLHCVRGLTLHDIGPEAADEITDAVAECERIVFWKRRDRIYLGRCEHPVRDEEGRELAEQCPGEVYADEGAAVGECEECSQGVTVVIRRAELEKRLDDQLHTAAEIAGLATYLGLPVGREQVRKRVNYWHRHKRIIPHGRNEAGDPTFRYGEVRTMLYAEYSHAESRGA